MKWLTLIVLALTGCALQQTGDNIERALETAANPDSRIIYYEREGNTVHYYRKDCAGKYCQDPPE